MARCHSVRRSPAQRTRAELAGRLEASSSGPTFTAEDREDRRGYHFMRKHKRKDWCPEDPNLSPKPVRSENYLGPVKKCVLSTTEEKPCPGQCRGVRMKESFK